MQYAKIAPITIIKNPVTFSPSAPSFWSPKLNIFFVIGLASYISITPTVAITIPNPNKNFIGIDVKGARFWRGAKTAVDTGMNNVAFIRTQIELINHIFAENEVSEIWITFPDPQIKYKRTKHRMTNSEFLQNYKKVLKQDGLMHLKTDSEFMHGYTLGLLHGEGHEVIYANHNIYKNEGSPAEVTGIQTFYENQYLEVNKAITYIQFKIK